MFSDNINRSIISGSYLEDMYGADVSTVRRCITWKDGSETPIQRVNGLYYVTFDVSPTPDVELEANAAVAAAARLKVTDQAALHAARFNTDADGVISISRCVSGIDIDKISRAAAEVIDRDRFLALSRSKKKPVRSTPTIKRAPCAGHTFIFDGFGRTEAESALNGHTYQFHGVCQYTSYGYTETTRRHTTDDWKPFMRKVHSDAERAGHEPKVFIVDAGSDLVALKSWCESELKVKFIIAPRQHHEFVGTAEVNNDILTRWAERADSSHESEAIASAKIKYS